MAKDIFSEQGFSKAVEKALELATGKKNIKTSAHAINSRYRLFIRVGILGPDIGGQCILDIPLLTALNLSAYSLSGKNFSDLNLGQRSQNQTLLRQLLGLPVPENAMVYECRDQWIKSIEVDLGPLYDHIFMNISIRLNAQQEPDSIILRAKGEPVQNHILKNHSSAQFELNQYRFELHVEHLLKVLLSIDESAFTLSPVPSKVNEDHILTEIDAQKYLIKGPSTLVQSRLLELGNQVVPSLIPSHLTGDISTPRLIPGHMRRLPIPFQKYQTHRLIMGIGPLGILLNLCHIADLNKKQINILKSLFDYTFYHPELKRIYG